ncbi:MAG: hypothetical protein U0K47_05060 [Erysipelotrichaceae bacterium]|nr:hypothetical protein [Erysipelotrichaceae bacterium]
MTAFKERYANTMESNSSMVNTIDFRLPGAMYSDDRAEQIMQMAKAATADMTNPSGIQFL